MPRLLIINYAFPPFGGAASRRVTKMVKYLDRRGWESVVITAPRIINPLIDAAAVKEVPPSTTVIRTFSLEPLPPIGRDGPWLIKLRCLLNVPLIPDVSILWAVCAVWPALSAVRRYQPQVILCSGPEFSGFVLGRLIKAVTKTPLVLDYRDEWSFHPVKQASVQGAPLRRVKQRLELALEKRIAWAADRIIANTESFKREFMSRLGVDGEKIAVISNGFDREDFPAEAAPCSETGPLVITHLGSIDHESLFPVELLQAIDDVAATQERGIELRMIGNVYPELRRRIESAEFKKLKAVFTGFLPARDSLSLLHESHLNLLINELLPGKERYHNLKLFDYLLAKAPILFYGPVKSEIGEVVSASGLGSVVEPGDEQGIAEFFFGWLSSKINISPDHDFIARFDWTSLAETLDSVLREAGKGAG